MHRVPAPALFVVSGLTQYYGAALAIGLFVLIEASAVAWLRLVAAALLLLAWRRPWRRRWTRQDLLGAGLFGTALAAMNVTFYIAIEHLPLGTAVAIEFVGPVAVAAITGRGWRERIAIGLAAVGVVLLAGVTLSIGGPGAATSCWVAGSPCGATASRRCRSRWPWAPSCSHPSWCPGRARSSVRGSWR